MRAQPDRADDADAGLGHVETLLARAADRRFYGAYQDALALCIESGSRDGLRDLAQHAFEAMEYQVCLEALQVAKDVRRLIDVGQYLSAYSAQWGQPFFEAAREIRRARRDGAAHSAEE